MTCKYLAYLRPIHAFAWVPGALALAVLLVGGCTKEEPREETPPTSANLPTPEEYMRDPVFREKLDAHVKARSELLAQRARVVRQLEAMSRAMVAKMPGASEEEIVAELEKDPEWRSLAKRANELVKAYDENQDKTLQTVRTRLTTPTTLSK